jgi:hypothetical protein
MVPLMQTGKEDVWDCLRIAAIQAIRGSYGGSEQSDDAQYRR